jgi:hypothetical protein
MKYMSITSFTVLLVACGSEGGDSVWWNNQKTIMELEQKLGLARFKLEIMVSQSPTESQTEGAVSAEVLREEITSMELRKSVVAEEIAKLRNEWPDFRAETLQRRRASAMGEVEGDFHLPDGRVLRAARVTKIDDGGVSISHDTGAARLRFGDLDETLRARFGLDRELAALAEDRESEQRAAYERWHAEMLRANELERQRLAEARRVEENRLKSARLLASAGRAVASGSLSSSIGALGETSTVSGTTRTYSRSRGYGNPSVRYRYYQPVPVRCATGVPFWRSSNPFFGSSCHSYTPRPFVSHGHHYAR